RVAPVPYDKIDWAKLYADAVWRRPPFVFDPKKAETEKGFRDALILETVVDVVVTDARNVNLVFICADQLLRRTADQSLSRDDRFSAYENVAGFSSYVKLTREQLDNEFIKQILDRT